MAGSVEIAGLALEGEFKEGDFLPLRPGLLRWEDSEGPHEVMIETPTSQEPGTLVRRILRQFGKDLNEAGPPASDVSIDSLATVRFATLEDVLKPQLVDSAVERVREHLFHVCERPRVELRTEEIVQPLDQVRRPSRRAIEHLARNPQFLGSPGQRDGRPERLLAELVEETRCTYENRFVVTLIDRLRDLVHVRLREVADVHRALHEQHEELLRVRELGQAYRRRRLAQRLARAHAELDEGRIVKDAEALARALDDQQGTLLSCMASGFFEELATSPRVSDPIRPTNVLVHDPHYGPLYDLWCALERERPKPKPLDHILDDPDAMYRDFVVVMLAKAIRGLGFRVSQGRLPLFAASNPGDAVLFVAPEWTIEVRGRSDNPGDLDVSFAREQRPRAAVIRGGRVTWRVRSRFRSLRDEAEPRAYLAEFMQAEGVLSLFPEAATQNVTLDDARVQVLVHPFDKGGCVAIVSPLDFASEDRLGAWVLGQTVGPRLRAGEQLQRCPVCRVDDPRQLRRDEVNCFSCGACHALWGRKSCATCQDAIPYLLPGRPSQDVLTRICATDATPWESVIQLERIVGRDHVSTLRWDPGAPGSFHYSCSQCEARAG